MTILSRFPIAVLTILVLAAATFAAVDVKQEADKVSVTIDGQLFTEYHFTNARRPYFYPVIGPTGGAMTRHWPLQDDIASEERDHPHHKGLWYGHRSVNGIGFWEETGKPETKLGQIVHESFEEVKGGEDAGVIREKNKWVADGSGEVICTDERTITIYKAKEGRLLDFNITIKAGDKEVVFGDDKDGVMAIRVPETMRVEKPKAKDEKTAPAGEGHIITSEGKKDAEAWGTRADWCDYYGPAEGKTAGIAMFDHPDNPRHPTWWHVRPYGLFAANAFGQAQFEKLPEKAAGEFKIAPGQSATFRYRFYFHEGNPEQARVADRYRDYIATVK